MKCKLLKDWTKYIYILLEMHNSPISTIYINFINLLLSFQKWFITESGLVFCPTNKCTNATDTIWKSLIYINNIFWWYFLAQGNWASTEEFYEHSWGEHNLCCTNDLCWRNKCFQCRENFRILCIENYNELCLLLSYKHEKQGEHFGFYTWFCCFYLVSLQICLVKLIKHFLQ